MVPTRRTLLFGAAALAAASPAMGQAGNWPVRPLRIIAAVESMFSTSFVAVPAFNRLDPARISGPTSTTMGISTASVSAESGTQVTQAVTVPSARAAFIAATT